MQLYNDAYQNFYQPFMQRHSYTRKLFNQLYFQKYVPKGYSKFNPAIYKFSHTTLYLIKLHNISIPSHQNWLIEDLLFKCIQSFSKNLTTIVISLRMY